MKKVTANKKINFTRNGFTLVEALVAVSLVLVGVTTAFSAAQFGLSSTSAVRNRVSAMFLAQEALEGVKNIKDENLLKRSGGSTINWLENINTAPLVCTSNAPCGYDAITGTLSQCATIQDCKIVKEANTGFFRQMNSGGTDTGFIRTVSVQEITPGNEAKVTVTISRPGFTNFPDFSVVDYVYNWF